MKLDGTFLRSRVARRIFVLFLLSALIPAALIALLSFRELTALLLDQKRAELLNLSKASSMAMYERLLLVEDLLKQFQPDLASPGRFRIDPSVRAKGKIASLSVVQDHGKPPLPSGLSAALQYDLSASERDHLAAGNTLLVSVSQSAGAGRVFMMRVLTEGNPGPRYLLAELDPAFLWGDASELPYRTDMFVVSGLNQILYRSSPTLPPVASALARTNPRDARAQLEWVDNQVRHVAGYYTVFLKPHFLAAGWTVVASQPESEALHPAVAFTHLFLPVLGLAILLVGLLSATQIRRTLVPLEGLIDGTRRIASQDFGARIAVNSSDEFGELAASFNSMASRVGRQFHALTTLSEIDRVILSTLNVDRVLEMVLARLYDIVPADYVCITVADSDNPQAGRSHVQDYLNRVGPSVTRTQLTLEETEELLAAQDAFWQDRDGSTKGYLAPLAPLGAAAFFVLPVIWKGSLSGVIVLGYRERPILSPDEIAHARDFRDRLAVALSTAARDEQLYFQARYDALTALPNRLYFKDQLTQELTTAAREQACLAVLFIDIDHFKDVNDTAGHPSGDALLQEVAVRLRKCVRESDFIARLGGDEFTILVPSLIAPEAAGRTAEQIVQAMARPFIVEGQERFLSASVGIAVYPHDGRTGDELIKNADTAMYRAKATGRSRSVYFEERMNTEARARVALERELRRATAREEFELHYQPQLDLRSGAVSGAEALVRWRHPHRDILAPFHFIGLAEELGLIEPLGRWILATASSQYRLMEAQGIHLERLSVNVSARQFRQQHFVDLVKRLIDEAAMPPHCLELEITETLLMTADHGIEGTLRAFKSMGIHLALDDFGTGYSSLAYLKQFPIDVVKIDRSFVKDLGTDTESRAICAAIIAMAHALCKEVVAEGVETEQQLAVLRNLGCDRIQGYYLAKPLPLTAFVDFVATRAGACTTP